MKPFIIICAVFFGLMSCQKAQDKPFTEGDLLIGLATPVQLSLDTTEVVISDYFPSEPLFDSIVNTAGLQMITSEDQQLLWLIYDASQPMRFPLKKLSFYLNANRYDVIVKRPAELKTMVQVDAHLGSEIKLKGEFTNWNTTTLQYQPEKGGFEFQSKPGKYQYILVVDGKEMLNPDAYDSISNGMGGFNSLVTVGNVDIAPLYVTTEKKDNQIIIRGDEQLAGVKILHNNFELETERLSDTSFGFSIPHNVKNRSHIRAYAYDESRISNDLLLPLNGGEVIEETGMLNRSDFHTNIMYFMMVDRFKDGDTTNNFPVKDPTIMHKANYWGGDLAGILKKLRDGYFDELGINTIWVSPITQNPFDAWGQFKDPNTTFSGYHGYWPITSTTIDFRFGNDAILKELLAEAHKREMNVLLDYVANHVHMQHAVYQKHPDWVTPLYLPDGRMNTELWDEQRLTTWFDTFLPTLNLMDQKVTDFMVDSALFWVTEYDFDGFRHDATKHIPNNFWRSLTQKVKQEVVVKNNQPIYQIGETYGSHDLISSYLNTGMLDAQFDFNLFDHALAVFAQDEPFNRLTSSLKTSLRVYGNHHLMGNITGNQDKPRFISFADGTLSSSTPWDEYKRIGWKNTIGIKDSVGYDKMKLLNAFNLTIPGIPIIYYGDEIGMPGAGDPDNRRMMRFEQLNQRENDLKRSIQDMIKMRKNHMALNYGDLVWLYESDEVIAFSRNYLNDHVLVVINNGQKAFNTSVLGVNEVEESIIEANDFLIVSF